MCYSELAFLSVQGKTQLMALHDFLSYTVFYVVTVTIIGGLAWLVRLGEFWPFLSSNFVWGYAHPILASLSIFVFFASFVWMLYKRTAVSKILTIIIGCLFLSQMFWK